MLSAADREFFLKVFENAPVKRPLASIAQWVEGRRILPPNTPIPGPWRNSVTPYGIEIMDSLAPNSGIERVAIVKARKAGLTTIMENVVAYYMLENPSDILYSTATDDLAKDWGDRKIGYVIDSLGGRDKITANITNAKQRRTGDTSARKEYIGGALDIISSGSKMARRAMDKRCLFVDEVDGLASLTATGEGKWTEILFGHTAAWGARRKIAMFSSPTTMETSLINEYYGQGDCRHFFVPCPYCGELIELSLDVDPDAAFGLKTETKDGQIISAYYVCEKCEGHINNSQKTEMFSENPHCLNYPEKVVEKYRWQPTRISDDKTWRSYYLNALYSPIGMVTFTDVAKARARADDGTPDDMRSYVNIYAGLPYKDTGSRPKLSTVIALKGNYASGTVPEGVLFLTAAVDVQAGSQKDPDNPPRLEMEVLGHGAGYRTWSVTYKVFTGDTGDPDSGAWEKLYDFCRKSFVFKSKEGVEFSPQVMFIDSGNAYEGRHTVVYRFCERLRNTYPVKGFADLLGNR
jgi:phage terminase large subunit GpA-like protein